MAPRICIDADINIRPNKATSLAHADFPCDPLHLMVCGFFEAKGIRDAIKSV